MCQQALAEVDFAEGPRQRVAETREFLEFLEFMLAEMPALMEKGRSRRDG